MAGTESDLNSKTRPGVMPGLVFKDIAMIRNVYLGLSPEPALIGALQ
jgi:hypothetical protein